MDERRRWEHYLASQHQAALASQRGAAGLMQNQRLLAAGDDVWRFDGGNIQRPFEDVWMSNGGNIQRPFENVWMSTGSNIRRPMAVGYGEVLWWPYSDNIPMPFVAGDGDDIWRRFYDMQMPLAPDFGEGVWGFYDNNIGSSSSAGGEFAVKMDEDVFTLHFKGLASEKDPSLAAVGMPVCDSDGNVVIKIQKRVEPLGKEVLDATALVEGLKAALSVGITHLHVFVDSVLLYNYVTGRWPLTEHHDTIRLAKLLQKNFEVCNIYVLPESQSQDVIRLAKDVIDSHKKDKMKDENQQSKETCTICLEEYDSYNLFTVDNCNHRFCFSCMRRHAEVQLLHGILPGCLQEGCKIKLDVENCKKFLPPKLSQTMADRVLEASIPVDERVYCPYPRCSAVMSMRNTIHEDRASSSSQTSISSTGARRCEKCNNLFCISCKVPWHEEMSCIDFQKFSAPVTCSGDEKLKALASSRLWRQCIDCDQMIERIDGCDHMTCRCGAHFCYTCGSPWPSCSCFNQAYHNNVLV